jgi:hypothetical protein
MALGMSRGIGAAKCLLGQEKYDNESLRLDGTTSARLYLYLPSLANAIELEWYLTPVTGKASCAVHPGIETMETLESD